MTPPRPLKIPVSVLVVIHTIAGEVLLIRRADSVERWQSVTGSLDAPDEPRDATAWREVAEETGITQGELRDWQYHNVYEIYLEYRWRYPPGVTHNTEHVFGLTLPARVPVTLNPREHLDHLWLPWQDAAARCFSPSNREAILRLPGYTMTG